MKMHIGVKKVAKKKVRSKKVGSRSKEGRLTKSEIAASGDKGLSGPHELERHVHE